MVLSSVVLRDAQVWKKILRTQSSERRTMYINTHTYYSLKYGTIKPKELTRNGPGKGSQKNGPDRHQQYIGMHGLCAAVEEV